MSKTPLIKKSLFIKDLTRSHIEEFFDYSISDKELNDFVNNHPKPQQLHVVGRDHITGLWKLAEKPTYVLEDINLQIIGEFQSYQDAEDYFLYLHPTFDKDSIKHYIYEQFQTIEIKKEKKEKEELKLEQIPKPKPEPEPERTSQGWILKI